jgi:DNA-binding CsgD family transcriptional regulator/tetratricopeptide (TPR) repeat protein
VDDLGTAVPRPSVLAARLVGRARELAALGDRVAAATQGRGGVVFLLGEAGIGKSRLTQATASDAEPRGFRVLRGRAVPTATPVAYRPLAEALSSAVRAGTQPDADELSPFRATLGRLVADWRDHEHLDVDDSVLVLAEGVLRFLRGVARDGGCLMVLEDLHWADSETLTIVEYLADNLAAEHVLCIATVRDEGTSLGLDLARTLHARRTSELIELGRLADAEVAEMLDSCLGADVSPELMALAARAEGVPFLVEELLAVAVASGALVPHGTSWTFSGAADHVVPLTFADSVRRRLAALGDERRTVLLAAAVLGRQFDWKLLPSVAGADEDTVGDALHAAVDAHIVAVDLGHGTFRFRHALSRDAVLAELLPSERARLSERALAAIETAHPGLPGDWCELAAEVAEGAADRRRAAALLLEAGRRALDGGALATAEATLERARALMLSADPIIVDIEECLATVLALAGKRDRAVEVGESLLDRLGTDAARAPRRAEAHLRIARAAVAATRWTEAEERLAQASEQASEIADDELRARIDVLRAQVAMMSRPDRAADLARGALEVAERLELPEVACEALEIVGRFERQRDLDAAESAFARAYAIADEHGRTVWRMRALHELGTIELLRDGGVTRLEQARELALSLGALATVSVLDVQIAAALSLRDDPEPAGVVARRAGELATRYHLDQPLAAALAFEAVSHARAGRRAEVDRCLTAARHRGEAMSDFGVVAAFARALLAFVEEDRVAARREVELSAVVPSEAIGDQATGPGSGMLALLIAVEGGSAGGPGWPSQEPAHFLARGYFRYAEAVVAGRARDAEAALVLLDRGDEHLGSCSWYRHLGRRLVAEPALTDEWGDPVAWLRDALAFFDRRGDARIASACRSLLRKAGAPVPRRRSEEPAMAESLHGMGVTARELEVLRLLGEGLSNKDIAARLYLSPRTVERHVASLTAKAGVTRRSELVAFAARTVVPN